MSFRTIFTAITILGFTLSGCKKSTELSGTGSNNLQTIVSPQDSVSINPKKILVDASKDGGA
jgi:hypothetical protein